MTWNAAAALFVGILMGCQQQPSAVPPPAESPAAASSQGAASTALPSASASASPTPLPVVCGNDQLDSGETCDDGNSQGGDGCSSGCRREPVQFLSWGYALLADGSLVARGGTPEQFVGPSVVGTVVSHARGSAFVRTAEGLRYFYGEKQLVELPPDSRVLRVGSSSLRGVGCFLSHEGQVWCSSWWEDCGYKGHFKPGSESSPGPWKMTWCELGRSPGVVTALSGTLDYGCVLVDDGRAVQCWNKEVRSPKMTLGRQRQATQISTGLEHVCVLLTNGEVGCWGDASFGQLGYMGETLVGQEHASPGIPVSVRRTPPAKFLKFDPPAQRVLASDNISCALLENDELWCWGETTHLAYQGPNEPTHSRLRMMLPDGLEYKPVFASTMPSSPMMLPEDCEVKHVALLSQQLCVVCKDGCGKCWGNTWNHADVRKSPGQECLSF